ncbi:unnamed protein product, partial [Urochloa humidicola]
GAGRLGRSEAVGQLELQEQVCAGRRGRMWGRRAGMRLGRTERGGAAGEGGPDPAVPPLFTASPPIAPISCPRPTPPSIPPWAARDHGCPRVSGANLLHIIHCHDGFSEGEGNADV